jgi:hypothetical protein
MEDRMSASPSFLNTLHGTRDKLERASKRLRARSFHLSSVGMTQLAEDLADEADEIETAVRTLMDSFDEDLRADCKSIHDQIGAVLKAAIERPAA